MRTDLHSGWTVQAASGAGLARLGAMRIPATVPGCVHLDLMAADLIPDPLIGENETMVAWVGRTDWTYSTVVQWSGALAGTRVHLVAEGLDTVAEVRLNGTIVGRTRNMHRAHRFDVTQVLCPGPNDLEVAFTAPLDAAEAASAELGLRPHVNAHPYNAVRKNASAFGWDWGPNLPSSGIWRAIALEEWSTARLAEVRPLVDVLPDGSGELTTHVAIERADDADLVLRVLVAGIEEAVTVPAGQSHATVRVVVPEIALWWPRGYGQQARYDVAVDLERGGEVLDSRSARVGFRTVEVQTPADERGTGFQVVVNGQRVLVRGFNWIPDDPFPSRVDRSRYERRIRQACDANANLLRVWGGGIYESDDFYDVCDELGVLVWQDFLFACAAYAEEPALAMEVEAEARGAVARLSSRPSLALWCGGNECLWGFADWDWQEPLAGRTWGQGYYTGLLPSVVAELDPTRPYIPGSPYSPAEGGHPNDPAHGPMHIWDVWNERDYTAYLEYEPRFVSEFGFQGPPTWATLARALDTDSLAPDSPAMLAHQKAEDGNGKLQRGMAAHLPPVTGFDDWHWATSLNQARAVALGVEHFRSQAPWCTGAVVWQLNDCWPVTSWSAVDGDGRRKPLWYALRRSFADRVLVLEQEGTGQVVLGVVNDCADSWVDSVLVRRIAPDGTTLATEVVGVDVPPRSAVRVTLPESVTGSDEPSSHLLVAEADGLRTVRPFAEDADALLTQPDLEVRSIPVPGGWEVSVTTDVLVRDLALLVDRIDADAVVDDMLVTLLPGESATFRVSTSASLTAQAFSDPLVLRSANQLCARVGVPVRAG